MRFLLPVSWALLVVLASGCSLVVKDELDQKPAPDAGPIIDEFCRGRDDGYDCSTPAQPDHICLGLRCVETQCGDGFTDAPSGEQCDDGNAIPNDGCEGDCTITCETSADCDDGDICNGGEECGLTNAGEPTCRVVPGALLPPVGSPCGFEGGDGGVATGTCSSEGVCTPL